MVHFSHLLGLVIHERVLKVSIRAFAPLHTFSAFYHQPWLSRCLLRLEPGAGLFLVFIGTIGWLLLLFQPVGLTATSGIQRTRIDDRRSESMPGGLLPPPGDCGPERFPSLLFEEDVEAGPSGWTHGGLSDQWDISDWRQYDGVYAWHAPAPAYVTDQSLSSPSIPLPAKELPLTLRFWHYRDFEASSTGCYDGALLEISTDDGQSWTQLNSQLIADPYDGIVEISSDNHLAGRAAWCGHPQDWIESIAVLDEFAGQAVRFRFRIGTNGSQGREGWYLDNLRVQSCPSAYIAEMRALSSQSGLPGDSILHHFQLKNQGLSDQYSFLLERGSWPALLLTPTSISLSSGEIFTASVQVDLPTSPGGQQMEDTFQLSAISVGNPELILPATGISSLLITPGLELSSDQSLLVGKPGEVITHTFSLTNTGDAVDNFQIRLVQANWPVSIPPDSGLLQPGSKKSIPVQVTVPVGPLFSDEVIITDTFKLQVSSGWSQLAWGEAQSTTRAGLTAGLWLGGPTSLDALADRPLQVNFYVINLGNFADRYSLEWQGDWLAGMPVSQTGWVVPGGRGDVPVTILPPPQTPAGEFSTIVFKATSQLDPSKKSQLYITVYNRTRLFLPLVRQYQTQQFFSFMGPR